MVQGLCGWFPGETTFRNATPEKPWRFHARKGQCLLSQKRRSCQPSPQLKPKKHLVSWSILADGWKCAMGFVKKKNPQGCTSCPWFLYVFFTINLSPKFPQLSKIKVPAKHWGHNFDRVLRCRQNHFAELHLRGDRKQKQIPTDSVLIRWKNYKVEVFSFFFQFLTMAE